MIFLAGADGNPGPVQAPASPGAHDRATQWFRARIGVTRPEWDAFDEQTRRLAFTVSGLASSSLVKQVQEALAAAIERGESFEDFRARLGESLANSWGDASSGRLETIFRNAVQHAYGAQRFEEMSSPAALADRPYWRFEAILDGRTTQVCEQRDGVLRPATDGWWITNWPPLHHRCRSGVISLSEDQTHEEGGISYGGAQVAVPQGWGAAPGPPPSLPLPPPPAPAPPPAPKPPPAPPAPPPKPPAPAVPTVPVSKAFHNGAKAKRPEIATALAAIEKVHRAPVARTVPVYTRKLKQVLGQCRFAKSGPEIQVNTVGPWPEHTATHEIGHALDFILHKGKLAPSALLGDLSGWWSTILQSQNYADLQQAHASRKGAAQKYTAYLLSPEELFARSYAQWIAVRSGDPTLLQQLRRRRIETRVEGPPQQWEDKDFESVAAALDDFFHSQGLMP